MSPVVLERPWGGAGRRVWGALGEGEAPGGVGGGVGSGWGRLGGGEVKEDQAWGGSRWELAMEGVGEVRMGQALGGLKAGGGVKP